MRIDLETSTECHDERIVVKPLLPLERTARQLADPDYDKPCHFLPTLKFIGRKAKAFKRLVAGLSLSNARECLAFIYGFARYSELHPMALVTEGRAFAANLDLDSELYDEDLSAERLEARRNYQSRRLHAWSNLDLQQSRALIDELRPSAIRVKIDAPLPDPDEYESEKDDDQSVADKAFQFVPHSIIAAARKATKIQKLVPGITMGQARRGLAYAYGFASWTRLSAEVHAPREGDVQWLDDESLPLEQLRERRDFQARRIQQALPLDFAHSRALVAIIQPSAGLSSTSEADLSTSSDVDEEYDKRIWHRINQDNRR